VRPKTSCLALSWALILGGSGLAFAQEPSRAEALFNAGVEDMLAGRYDTGCASIRQSQELEPKPGGLFTLAECYSRAGRIASAVESYAAYLSAYETLPAEQRTAHAERAGIARTERDKLTPDVPQIVLAWPGTAPERVQIARDGTAIDTNLIGRAQRVDPGDHVFSVTYPDGQTSERRINIARGQKLRVVLPERDALEDPDPDLGETEPDDTTDQPPPPSSSSTRTWAYVTGGIGVAGILAGSITGVMVLGKAKDIDSKCQPLANSNGTEVCRENGADEAETAKKLGTVSTISFGIGIVGLAIAVPLFLTAPSSSPGQTQGRSLRLTAKTTPRMTEISLGGSF
jgi:hypothetical protein